MINFISIDTEFKRNKLFGFIPWFGKTEIPTHYCIYSANGISTSGVWHVDTVEIIEKFISDSKGELGMLFPDQFTSDTIIYEETDNIPCKYEWLISEAIKDISDQTFIAKVMDFKKHIPESRRPYSDEDKIQLAKTHKDYKTILPTDKCNFRAQAMYDNYSIFTTLGQP